MRAFITGGTGQDGSILADQLLELDYEVAFLIRRHSNYESELGNIKHLQNHSKVKFFYGDVLDQSSVESALSRTKPHEIYHLAAQSHVKISFDVPQMTMQTNIMGTLNVLESMRLHCPYARLYNAATSEMYGNIQGPQNEQTPMLPVSPYGISKLAAFDMCRIYRKSYGLFISSGILFNHESSRRGQNFVTAKVVLGALDILNGKKKELKLGNLNARRDWGNAKDYCRAMKMMLEYSDPDDFVISTGKYHSVRDLCRYVFSALGIPNWETYIVEDSEFVRPNELHDLLGDASKAKTLLGWEPEYTFEQTIDEMIDYWSSQIK